MVARHFLTAHPPRRKDAGHGVVPVAGHVLCCKACRKKHNCVIAAYEPQSPYNVIIAAYTPIISGPTHQLSLAIRFFTGSKMNNPMPNTHESFMQLALQLADEGWRRGDGGPFGAVIVKDGTVIGRGNNRVLLRQDPTAHAELEAIREACQHLQHFQLDGCILYTSCEPCPMCLGAIYWARPAAVYYACTREDAAAIGFDDHFIYQEIDRSPEQRKIPAIGLLRPQGLEVFEQYKQDPHTHLY
jgi:tRNA(Arg) A34 adenosine deaminase TadA